MKHVEHPDAVKRGADACDRLAGSGVPYPQIDANPAVKACLSAVDKVPSTRLLAFTSAVRCIRQEPFQMHYLPFM